jgi:D-glycero-D-manno-heptose 1,7-bisphosphate phosphatase
MINRAAFLDRDGVLVCDSGLITEAGQFVLLEGVPDALWLLKRAGFRLIVVTNQAVVARGLISERGLLVLHDAMQDFLMSQGAPRLDAIYACPHHPNASLPEYRHECQCRKPRPGLLLQAAQENDLDLRQSFMIGDRLTDIAAGQRAGCGTILVQTGQHLAAPIQTVDNLENTLPPDYVEPHLYAAAERMISLS